MSFMNDFFRSIARTLGRIFVYLTLGAIAYFIGQKFVFAQGQYRYINNVNNNTSNWFNVSMGSEYTNSPVSLNSTGKSVFQFRDPDAFGTNKYDLILDFEYTITANGIYVPMASNNKPVDVFAYIAIEVYNGSTLKNISSQCTTNYAQTSTYPNDNQAIMVLNGTITCTAVDGQGYYPYFSFSARQTGRTPAPTSVAKIKFNSWTYRVNQAASDTNAIINSQNAGTQSIINNNNSNTESIINNQNNNTTEITNAIDNINQVCNNYNLIYDSPEQGANGYLDPNGIVTTNTNDWYYTSDYIPINEGKTYNVLKTFSGGQGAAVCLYDESKTKLSCTAYNSSTNSSVDVSNANAKYLRLSFKSNNQNPKIILTGEYCYNAAEEQVEATQEINNTLTDSSVDDPSSSFSSMQSLVPTNGVVSGILLLPVQLYQAVLNSIDGTCSDFSLGTLYNHSLTMPCINLSARLGSTLYGVIDILISGLFVLAIRKKFVDIFQHFTSLKSGGNELE